MKEYALGSLCAALVFLGAGCASAENKAPQKDKELVLADFAGTDENAVKLAAQPFAQTLFLALQQDQFAIWQKEIPETFSSKITPESFQKMRTDLLHYFGTPEKCDYLGMLDQGKVRDSLWKIRFVKTQENAPAIPHEIVLWVRVYREAGKAPAVGGFGFHPF